MDFPYVVLSGDSLSKIVQKFRSNGMTTSVQAIVDRNATSYPTLRTNPNNISVGWLLFVPVTFSGSTAPTNTGSTGQTNQTFTGQRFFVTFQLTGAGYWTAENSVQLARMLANEFSSVNVDGNSNWIAPIVQVMLTSTYRMTAADAARIVDRYASSIKSINPSSWRSQELAVNPNQVATTGGTTPGGTTPGGTTPGGTPPGDSGILQSLATFLGLALGIPITVNTALVIIGTFGFLVWISRD